VLVRRGRFVENLGPGSHIVPGWTPATRIESYCVAEPQFKTEWTAYPVKHRPEGIEAHFTLLETTGRQIALVFLDGKLERVIAPGRRVLYWNVLRDVFVEVIAIDERPEVDKDHILALTKLGPHARPRMRTHRASAHARTGCRDRALDEVLAEKADVDAQAADAVRAEMVAIGIETGLIALKDLSCTERSAKS
jgi:hypothetical protein